MPIPNVTAIASSHTLTTALWTEDIATMCAQAAPLLAGGHLAPHIDSVPGHSMRFLCPILAVCDSLSTNAILHEACKEMHVCKKSLFPVEIILKILGNIFTVVMIVKSFT